MTKSADLIEQLSVIDENINAEAVRQPALFMDAVRLRVACMRRRAQAEAELESFVMRRSLVIRTQSAGKERATEGFIKARVHKHPKFKQYQSALIDAQAEEELAKLLLEAYRQRNSAIKILAESQNYEANKSVMDFERKDATRKLSNRARQIQQSKSRYSE